MVTRATSGELLDLNFGGSGLFVLRILFHSFLGMVSSAEVGGYWRHWEFNFMGMRAVLWELSDLQSNPHIGITLNTNS